MMVAYVTWLQYWFVEMGQIDWKPMSYFLFTVWKKEMKDQHLLAYIIAVFLYACEKHIQHIAYVFPHSRMYEIPLAMGNIHLIHPHNCTCPLCTITYSICKQVHTWQWPWHLAYYTPYSILRPKCLEEGVYNDHMALLCVKWRDTVE